MKFKIFLVDDDPIYQEMLQETLGWNPNYDVISFDNGEDCLKNLNDNPNVIVLDHHMDKGGLEDRMNGDEVLNKIQETNPKTPVIMLTSQTIPGKTYDFIGEGACSYIQKGKGDITEIENSIKEIYENKKAPTS